MPNQPYRLLAVYYDQFFEAHRAWLEGARRKILGHILPRTSIACDLACGTGTTALVLARRGIKMSGVDASTSMCRIARKKARRAGVNVQVLHADMRNFRLPEPVDLVTCEFDALNHVPRKQDLDRVAQAVARALRPGGHFFFDVNTRRAFKKFWPSTWWGERPGVAVCMHGGYDRHRDKGWSDVELFIRKGKLWQRARERVEEVAWTGAEIRRSLRSAGFDKIRAWDEAPFVRGEWKLPAGCRTIYLARKAT
ncbi:MAG: class I SAM-dependent methyltransferase [Acidobacteriia bacterium]|nr:class I SAM-dependent methyltransferase [Terriglobia bacterium]